MAILVTATVYSPSKPNSHTVKQSNKDTSLLTPNSAQPRKGNVVDTLSNLNLVKTPDQQSQAEPEDISKINDWLKQTYIQDFVEANAQKVPYASKEKMKEIYSTAPEEVKVPLNEEVSEGELQGMIAGLTPVSTSPLIYPYKPTENSATTFTKSITKSQAQKKIKKHYLIDISVQNSMHNSGSCVLKVTPKGDPFTNNFEENALKVTAGDIIEVTMSRRGKLFSQPFLFLGYVESVNNSFDETGRFVEITCKQFMNRLLDISFLGAAAKYGLDAREQVNIDRIVPKLIEQLRIGNYLQHVPITHDLANANYFAMFDIADSQGDVLSKVCKQFSRLFFQRRDGSMYITQMYNNALKDKFKKFQWSDVERTAESIYHNVDYSNIPYTLVLSYMNAPVMINELAAAKVTPIGLPNTGSEFESIKVIPINLPTNANISNTIAVLEIKAEESNTVKIELSEGLTKAISSEKNSDYLVNLVKLQALQAMYEYLPAIEQFSLRLPFINSFNYIDIGDMIQIPPTTLTTSTKQLWVVSEIQINFTAAYIDLTLIPLEHTSPPLSVK